MQYINNGAIDDLYQENALFKIEIIFMCSIRVSTVKECMEKIWKALTFLVKVVNPSIDKRYEKS